jgi:ADP-heptose:LPS heptosyltransferase
MSFKNALLKLSLRAIKPFAGPSFPIKKRILVVTTTALGDTLWATPALESLRKSFPEAYLGVATSPVGMEILKYNPYIDQAYLIEEPLLPKFLKLWKMLRKEEFHTLLLFHASQRLVLPLCSLIGAAKIVGTEGINKGLDSLLTDPLPNIYEHEISRRLKMVQHIGGSIHSETLSLFLQPEERLPKREGRWIALHPGSKDGFKRWPPEHFALVGRALKESVGCEILITGSREEEEIMFQTAAQIPGALVADRNLSLRSFAALLDQMDLLICNDTGPFHIACALGICAIGLYAPTDPSLCGPYRAKKGTVIAKKRSCTPCLKRKCRTPFCLLQIDPCEVIETASNLLRS